jgi:Dimerisation domain
VFYLSSATEEESGRRRGMEDPKGTPATKQATPERILQLGLGFWGSKMLLSAVEIGLFSELAKDSLDFGTLSERLMLHPRSARDFLDALVALGLLE